MLVRSLVTTPEVESNTKKEKARDEPLAINQFIACVRVERVVLG